MFQLESSFYFEERRPPPSMNKSRFQGLESSSVVEHLPSTENQKTKPKKTNSAYKCVGILYFDTLYSFKAKVKFPFLHLAWFPHFPSPRNPSTAHQHYQLGLYPSRHLKMLFHAFVDLKRTCFETQVYTCMALLVFL
jgi:hypothetical protein